MRDSLKAYDFGSVVEWTQKDGKDETPYRRFTLCNRVVDGLWTLTAWGRRFGDMRSKHFAHVSQAYLAFAEYKKTHRLRKCNLEVSSLNKVEDL